MQYFRFADTANKLAQYRLALTHKKNKNPSCR